MKTHLVGEGVKTVCGKKLDKSMQFVFRKPLCNCKKCLNKMLFDQIDRETIRKCGNYSWWDKPSIVSRYERMKACRDLDREIKKLPVMVLLYKIVNNKTWKNI